ncbi:MAG: hypothetical protein AAB597_01040 [Patescibacteria group bacterium]
MKPVKYRIGSVGAIFMLAAAATIDLLQILIDLVLGILAVGFLASAAISWAAFFGFWMWFLALGVSTFGFSGKSAKKKIFGISFRLLEAVPGIEAFPMWTPSIYLSISASWDEDREKAEKERKEEESKKSGGAQQRESANDNYKQGKTKQAA